MLSTSQKMEQKGVWGSNPKSGIIDFVANWYLLAARYVHGTNARVAFVSTNSIVQGEQTAILWSELNQYDVHIDFAHQTFAWENSSSGKAAVHCVIIGFSTQMRPQKKQLWTYEKVSGEPTLHLAQQINSYLVDAPNVIIRTRQNPLGVGLPPMTYGSMPRDDGQLSKISEAEASEIRRNDPIATKYLYPLIGATELLNGKPRFCLWLVDASPTELRNSKVISERVRAVREFRSASTASSTRSMAETAHLFAQIAQPKSDYIAVPRHSSSSRRYVPMAFKSSDVIASDALMTISNSNLFVFSIVMSSVFNVWLSAVSGRIKSDFRISQEITYNNFPLPKCSPAEVENLSFCAATINSARDSFPDATLSELYAAASMQKALLEAHKANDKAVLAIFGLKPSSSDNEILQMLFTKYAELSGELSWS
jgi:hypothetical protein